MEVSSSAKGYQPRLPGLVHSIRPERQFGIKLKTRSIGSPAGSRLCYTGFNLENLMPQLASIAPAMLVLLGPVSAATVRTIAAGTRHDGPDGDPLRCGLARPHGVYVDADGKVYIGDSENHRVRVLE